MDLLGTSDAAALLEIDERALRSLIADGRVEARKIGGRWLVDGGSLARYRAVRRPAGGILSPRSAWSVLALLEGREPPVELNRSERARARERADRIRSGAVIDLSRRATCSTWHVLPGLLDRLVADGRLRLTGARGRHRTDLVKAGPLDAYITQSDLAGLVGAFGLRRGFGDSNVTLRVPLIAWPFGEGPVWAAATAFDLLEEPDDRARAAGHELLRRVIEP